MHRIVSELNLAAIYNLYVTNPHISPMDAMIAEDFRCAPSMAHTLWASCGRPNLLLADLCRQRVPEPAPYLIRGPKA